MGLRASPTSFSEVCLPGLGAHSAVGLPNTPPALCSRLHWNWGEMFQLSPISSMRQISQSPATRVLQEPKRNGEVENTQGLCGLCDVTFQSSTHSCHEQPQACLVLPRLPLTWPGFPPHNDDIQLSHSFLDLGGNPCGLGVGAWTSKCGFFFSSPVALNCSFSFNFPLCSECMCARSGHMYSVWDNNPRQQ